MIKIIYIFVVYLCVYFSKFNRSFLYFDKHLAINHI